MAVSGRSQKSNGGQYTSGPNYRIRNASHKCTAQ